MRKVTTGVLSSDSADRHGSGLQTMRRVAPYLWPEGEAWVKRRGVAALGFLLFGQTGGDHHAVSLQASR